MLKNFNLVSSVTDLILTIFYWVLGGCVDNFLEGVRRLSEAYLELSVRRVFGAFLEDF